MSIYRTPVSSKRLSEDSDMPSDKHVKSRKLFSDGKTGEVVAQNHSLLELLTAKLDSYALDLNNKLSNITQIAVNNQTDIAGLKERLDELEKRPVEPNGDLADFGERLKLLEKRETQSSASPSAIARLTERLDQLETRKISTVHAEIPEDLANRVKSLEVHSQRQDRLERCSEIVVSNILVASESAVNCRDIFIKISGHLKVTINAADILYCRVLNRDRRGQPSSSVVPSDWNYMDFLVRLKSNDLKSKIMKKYFIDLKLENKLDNKKLGLSEMAHRVYLNDNLTNENFQIYKKAKAYFKVRNNNDKKLVESVYTSYGQVYVKTLDETIHRVLTMNDLEGLKSSIVGSGSE